MVFIFVTFIFFSSFYLKAQHSELPVDSDGKITFREVVPAENFTSAQLAENAARFFNTGTRKKTKKQKAFLKDSLKHTAKNSFLTYQKALGKHPDGEILYTITLEIKEGRYRYTLSGFMFRAYQRNRYGKFEAVKGKDQPLEKLLLKKQGAHRIKALVEERERYTAQLKAALIYQAPIVPTTPVVSEETDW